jgi:hypothetical protein
MRRRVGIILDLGLVVGEVAGQARRMMRGIQGSEARRISIGMLGMRSRSWDWRRRRACRMSRMVVRVIIREPEGLGREEGGGS